ncbi:hypothetical protein [Haloechinothrix sp. LS1_15]|uniref:hypothetical protein n=1 Tax=Haloechinothrix sp. LS1_15 TaxID=2652248 RepID=UPI0029470941|nr:hypothetical protein [Haloechinothrix sp. LS1_15]MDV6011368.1 hypothetical protein [Haloechinothrix sp. LS1_15]
MAQLTFFSAEASAPAVTDLAGLLCGSGQIACFADTAARLSVVVAEQWRAEALLAECGARGVDAQVTAAEDGLPCVRTAFRADLLPLARAWTRGAVKAVPGDLALDGAMLRLWMLACGWPSGKRGGRGYLLQLDTRATGTHRPLLSRLSAMGLTSAAYSSNLLGARSGGPAVRIEGVRRMRRLAELIGPAPPGAQGQWPAPARAVAAS